MRILTLSAIAISALAFTSAAHAQSASKLFIQGDMIRGNQAGAPPGCVLQSQFKHLEKVVFRIRVQDQDGNPLDDKALKALVVELPDGQKLKTRYGKHPGGTGPGTDNFWTAAWTIPTDYPTGTFAYKVTATDQQDHAQTWEPFKVVASQLQVMAGDADIKKPN